MPKNAQPTYIVHNPETGSLALERLPERLIPYAPHLALHLTDKFFGQPIDDDLLYCMNYETRQWIVRAYDEIDNEVCDE